jgi:predicted dehydrogenase
MQALVIGYGSIGARHARLLENLRHEVRCVSANPDCQYRKYSTINEALDHFSPELIIIANRTVDHFSSLDTVIKAGYSKQILVEKPLFDKQYDISSWNHENITVAYNFRHHPISQKVMNLLAGKAIHSARFHVGQYLPDWRPGTDYTSSYSANRTQGGGVLRDLSHELDLALWLLGPWKKVVAIGGHFSNLDIDSDDQYSLLMETELCPVVSIHMDYLNRTARRGFDIHAENISLHADFITGILEINGKPEQYELDRDATYSAQIQAITSGDQQNQCSLEQGVMVVKLIEAIETSASKGTWIKAE